MNLSFRIELRFIYGDGRCLCHTQTVHLWAGFASDLQCERERKKNKTGGNRDCKSVCTDGENCQMTTAAGGLMIASRSLNPPAYLLIYLQYYLAIFMQPATTKIENKLNECNQDRRRDISQRSREHKPAS